MIERARKRRAFEASLPDISEDAETWKNMMEMQQLEACILEKPVYNLSIHSMYQGADF
jgi:hypothetical protein